MPNRMMRDSALTSLTLNGLSAEAERLFWRLILVADDFGRFNADPRVLLAKCYPLKTGGLKPQSVAKSLEELVKAKTVRTYHVNDNIYGHFPSWQRHQRVRADKSKFPAPPADDNICAHKLSNVAVVEVEDEVEDERKTMSSLPTTPLVQNGIRGDARAVLAFLNDRTGKAFRAVDTHLLLIEARLKAGASVQDCKAVIARKVREWSGEPKTRVWLRPSTLFRASNFENYLGEIPKETRDA